MVFGPLADKPKLESVFGVGAGVFGVLIAATIILISALSALLYHWGVLQKIVAAMAWVMMRTMRTSGSESLAGASNIFLGQTEAALLIKPYLPKMTKSELMALMVTGFSTIATGVMVVYAGLPAMSAGHIITASVLGAPAGLAVAVERARAAEPAEPLLRGDELCLLPGPEIGRILALIDEERAVGTISSRDEALALARREGAR